MIDHYPSITAEDLNHAADLLGMYSNRPAAYPPDLKAELVSTIRREVRTMQAEALEAGSVATAVHPDLLALVVRAERDYPE